MNEPLIPKVVEEVRELLQDPVATWPVVAACTGVSVAVVGMIDGGADPFDCGGYWCGSCLACLSSPAVSHKAPEQPPGPGANDPTREEIRAACEKIRSKWTPSDRKQRFVGSDLSTAAVETRTISASAIPAEFEAAGEGLQ